LTESPTGTLAALQERYGPRYRWLLLLSVMVGTMASIMSSTIVNVAIPDLSQHFTLGQERAQWVSSGFMVAMTVSMLTTPWLLARYGYRRTYVGTMLLLMAGGIVGGFSNDFTLVLAARVAEGLAAGIVQPIPAIIILRAFEPNEQGRASGIFGMGVVLAPALGPSIGGVLVDLFGWRSIFFMVVPFCLASIWLACKFVPVSTPGGMTAQRGNMLDWRGLVLGSVGTLCLLNGLVELHGGGAAAGVLLLGAAAALVAFLAWQRRLKAGGGEPAPPSCWWRSALLPRSFPLPAPAFASKTSRIPRSSAGCSPSPLPRTDRSWSPRAAVKFGSAASGRTPSTPADGGALPAVWTSRPG